MVVQKTEVTMSVWCTYAGEESGTERGRTEWALWYSFMKDLWVACFQICSTDQGYVSCGN